ncbi:nuclear transport factor 2 family protein [Sphingobacterium sp. SRCM116780]|uniref:nuclear transport factor 2 family protein n=1 Tax=Sphingobacterium sp. SRCM116780 TaxID=2907623 RepID=UPI001F15D23F|nr:nuclear transport factor 2 family protein [Sphingobacterium sp. SRCM116780]UIR57882.1 nuclear transport factor 2 family protein [Sphingobacterium sp. SRCM116780]
MDAQKFAQEWINSWNSHDLENIMDHYADDIEIITPMIKLVAGIENGSLIGKDLIKDYWNKALLKFPDLHFELIAVTSGVNSVALYYKSIMNKMSIEVMFFDDKGLVNKMIAHYTN